MLPLFSFALIYKWLKKYLVGWQQAMMLTLSAVKPVWLLCIWSFDFYMIASDTKFLRKIIIAKVGIVPGNRFFSFLFLTSWFCNEVESFQNIGNRDVRIHKYTDRLSQQKCELSKVTLISFLATCWQSSLKPSIWTLTKINKKNLKLPCYAHTEFSINNDSWSSFLYHLLDQLEVRFCNKVECP